MPDLTKINKTIRQKRKENREKEKILRGLAYLLDPEKGHFEPKKSVNDFNHSYSQYEKVGDQNKLLKIREYINTIRPYLSDIINNHKTQGEWKIHSTMAINFISSKDSDETRPMHTKNGNIEIMMSSETDEIIEGLFESLFQRY